MRKISGYGVSSGLEGSDFTDTKHVSLFPPRGLDFRIELALEVDDQWRIQVKILRKENGKKKEYHTLFTPCFVYIPSTTQEDIWYTARK